jgi:hypothetical protein
MQLGNGGGAGLPLIFSDTLSNESGADIVGLVADGITRINLEGMTVKTTGQKLCLRFSDDGGSSFDASADYAYDRDGGSGGTANSGTEIQLTGNLTTNIVASVSGFIEIYNQSAQDRRYIVWSLSGLDPSNNVGAHYGSGYSFNPSGGTIDAVRLFSSSGNISGAITVQRVR